VCVVVVVTCMLLLKVSSCMQLQVCHNVCTAVACAHNAFLFAGVGSLGQTLSGAIITPAYRWCPTHILRGPRAVVCLPGTVWVVRSASGRLVPDATTCELLCTQRPSLLTVYQQKNAPLTQDVPSRSCACRIAVTPTVTHCAAYETFAKA
jgi:hypothetical protein